MVNQVTGSMTVSTNPRRKRNRDGPGDRSLWGMCYRGAVTAGKEAYITKYGLDLMTAEGQLRDIINNIVETLPFYIYTLIYI